MATAKELINSDLDRYASRARFGLMTYIRYRWITPVPGIVFSFAFRLCQHYRRRNRLLFYFFYWLLRRVKFRYGLDISYRTTIGPGLYIGHFGGVIVHGDVVIGANCNLSQGVTLGVLNRGPNAGVPVLGDRVFVGPGAIVLGKVHIGDDSLIGANSLVTFDVPASSVVSAAASQIVSQRGSSGYVGNLTSFNS